MWWLYIYYWSNGYSLLNHQLTVVSLKKIREGECSAWCVQTKHIRYIKRNIILLDNVIFLTTWTILLCCQIHSIPPINNWYYPHIFELISSSVVVRVVTYELIMYHKQVLITICVLYSEIQFAHDVYFL